MSHNWVTPSSVHSFCGESFGHLASHAIDDNTATYWRHGTVDFHWVIFDMGETKAITKIRLYQNGELSQQRWGWSFGMYVYVGDDPASFGVAVWEGILNSSGWQESGEFSKSGRYVKLLSKFSGDDQRMFEFDAYCLAGGDGNGDYSGGPWVDLGTISSIGDIIGPLNIPYSRVSDGLQTIAEKTLAAFTPWEWWFDYSGNLYFKQSRGTDKSATIHLVAGDQIGGSRKEQISKQTSQRVRVTGRGESADQDRNTSDWQEETSEMASNKVNGFYEKVESEKSLSSKEESDVWAQVLLAQNSPVRNEITITLENDWYTSGDAPLNPNNYDLGDYVTVTDPATKLTGKYRVKTIEKWIDGDGGEKVQVTVSKRRTDIMDRLSNLFKVMERMKNSSTYLDTLYAEGGKQRKIDANKVEDIWSQQASNEWATELPEDKTEDDDYLQECDPYGRIDYSCTKDEFEVYATAHTAVGWVYLYGTANKGDPLLNFSRDPKFTCEFEIDTTGADRTEWNTGTFISFGIRSIYNPVTPTDCGNWGLRGFGFVVKQTASNLTLEARLYIDGSCIKEVKIANISYDVRYIVEARLEWKEKVIKYYFGKSDVDKNDLQFGFRLRAILPIPLETQDIYNFGGNDYNNYLCPFHVVLWGQDGAINPEKPAIVIYRWKTQAIRAVEG